ncbi:hypothetical protein HJG60_001623 [Phyllostomus discolor]|uniref:DUF4709 domain-containing protein n=1 Tax=Phyllostomus discolor TaxID=89673 RepID=A0A834ETI1_9CHIR|nr:hypothetical protein HJG60_001623 [Phyllostomus discolor]
MIEKHYQQNEDHIRKCYNQQLADAIAIIRGMYRAFFEVEEEVVSMHDSAAAKITILFKKLKDKEELIKELKEELEKHEEFRFQKSDSLAIASSFAKSAPEKENLDFKVENERLLQVISALEEEIQLNLQENSALEDEIISLREKADKDNRTILKLADGRDKLRLELDAEKLLVQEMINKHKEEMEMRKKLESINVKVLPENIDLMSARSPEGKKAMALLPWSSQPKILSRRGTISRLRSASISSAHVKTKRVKTPTKSLKQEQPVVRTAHMATPCDTLFCAGAPVLLAIVHPHIIPHIRINKINSLNTPDSPYSLHTSGWAGVLAALLYTNTSLLLTQENATAIPSSVIYLA